MRSSSTVSISYRSVRYIEGLETLHRHLILTYTADDDRTERLMIPLELFTLLMDLKDGGQLLDVLSDDVFANLGVFTQRLAQETNVGSWRGTRWMRTASMRLAFGPQMQAS